MRVHNVSRFIYNHYEVDPSVSKRYHVETTNPGQFDLLISPVHAEDNAVFVCEDNAGIGQHVRARLTVVAWCTTEQDHTDNINTTSSGMLLCFSSMCSRLTFQCWTRLYVGPYAILDSGVARILVEEWHTHASGSRGGLACACPLITVIGSLTAHPDFLPLTLIRPFMLRVKSSSRVPSFIKS